MWVLDGQCTSRPLTLQLRPTASGLSPAPWMLLWASSMVLFTRGSNMPDNKLTKGAGQRDNVRLTRLWMNLSCFKGKEETSTWWEDGWKLGAVKEENHGHEGGEGYPWILQTDSLHYDHSWLPLHQRNHEATIIYLVSWAAITWEARCH